jgi:hypothetical protein
MFVLPWRKCIQVQHMATCHAIDLFRTSSSCVNDILQTNRRPIKGSDEIVRKVQHVASDDIIRRVTDTRSFLRWLTVTLTPKPVALQTY